jgi:hypothetical protein
MYRLSYIYIYIHTDMHILYVYTLSHLAAPVSILKVCYKLCNPFYYDPSKNPNNDHTHSGPKSLTIATTTPATIPNHDHHTHSGPKSLTTISTTTPAKIPNNDHHTHSGPNSLTAIELDYRACSKLLESKTGPRDERERERDLAPRRPVGRFALKAVLL